MTENHGQPMTDQEWDEFYQKHEQVWSGNANAAMVAEVTDLKPGRALDIGSGEGGDALWLAKRGWQVTAIDISSVALERAAGIPLPEGASPIEWKQVDLTAEAPPADAFELVSLQYFPIPREGNAVHGILASVAVGGTLLMIGHDMAEAVEHHGHEMAEKFFEPSQVADLLTDDWKIVANETRPRLAPSPPGAGFVRDSILQAIRQR